MDWTILDNGSAAQNRQEPPTPEQVALTAQMRKMLSGWEVLANPEQDWDRWYAEQVHLSVICSANPSAVYSAVVFSRENLVLSLRSSSIATPLPVSPKGSSVWLLGRQGIFRVVSVGTLWQSTPDAWQMDVEQTYRSQRRRHTRTRLQSPITLDAWDTDDQSLLFPLQMLDISEGGALLRQEGSGPPLPNWLTLRLPVATYEPPLQAAVQVLNQRTVQDPFGSATLYGVRWVENANDRVRVRNWRQQQFLLQYATKAGPVRHPEDGELLQGET